MISIHKNDKGTLIAELTDNNYFISGPDETLDLLAYAGVNDCRGIIIHESNLDPAFFDLKTKIAGEILQKFSNYKMKLAIVGDFSKYTSNSLRDFIRESNRVNNIYFTENIATALKKLV